MAHIELPLTEPSISFTSTGDCEVRRTVHSSGLRILTERVPGSRSVTVGFWIGAGSRDEDAGHHGSTHFLEHLLFKGTSTRDAFTISETFDAMGAYHNALTAKENTCYLARVRSGDLAEAVRVLGDQVSNSLLAADAFEMERTVILEELAMAADDPDDVCAEQFFVGILGDSPLARPIGGTVALGRAASPASDALGTSSCIRLSVRRKVDLPQPDGPISAVTLPASIVRLTFSRTLWSPNQHEMSTAVSVAGA
jgi:hypothetical protein